VALVNSTASTAPDVVMGFEVGWVTSTGEQARLPLADVWGLRFEDAAPVRRFVSYRGQRHLSGRWWSATVGRHVGYESWLERDHVMALDFDPDVVGIASQPFWLFWPSGSRRESHPPAPTDPGVTISRHRAPVILSTRIRACMRGLTASACPRDSSRKHAPG
jgi:hypothetical protein